MDPLALLGIAAVGLLGLLAAARWGHARGRAGLGLLPAADVPNREPARDASELYAISSQLRAFYEATAHPGDLLADATFRRGVALLRGPAFSAADLVGYFFGDNAIIACMAAQALRERGEAGGLEERMLDALGSVAAWPLFFALAYLAEAVPPEQPLLGRVLARAFPHLDSRLGRQFLGEFTRARAARGEAPRFGDELAPFDPERLRTLADFLQGLGSEPGGPWLEALQRWRRERIDTEFLASVGSLWDASVDAEEGILWHGALAAQVEAVETELAAARRRSVLLVGESGVGKTKLARAVAARFQAAGGLVFEAGALELLAGQIFHGQFEERMQRLFAQLRGQRILWLIPDFHALAESGTHRYSTTSALDLLLPHLESGAIAVLGECRPGPFEHLVLSKPRLATALAVRRLDPLPAAQTLELARRWWDAHAEPKDGDEVLHEAQELAQQYLGDRAAPGNLLRLLEITCQRLAGPERAPPAAIRVDDLIATLAATTGLPVQILDDRRGLDLDGLRRHFGSRVVGQPEAVDCLVERVAMLKAGLTDPTRPFGVFLFAGPTGTGKTEIAKTLAEYLFGSADRMLRIDMSELQTPEDLDRLVGSSEAKERGDALVDRIREQPFSVVLLDEFEKGHRRSWDLFLQVFDDGRLSDRRGRVADFRYSIVILTSNLGSAAPSGEPLGFASEPDRWRARDVVRAIEGAFRPEFRNRLDRVVVFRPLDRETMRGILRKELEDVFQRRGLRARPWAVEWDPAAIEFLLEAGFSPTFGARPLKRAVERYLLAPLAGTIVRHEFPTGDQFLYVTLREGVLEVQFIDPDAPAEVDPAQPASEPEAAALDEHGAAGLKAIARDPRGAAEELALLEVRFERLRAAVESESWRERKETALAMTSLADFWRSPDRFEILGNYEYQARIEAGMRRIGSLLERLRRRHRDRLPTHLLASVAQTLLLLEVARGDVEQGRPQAAFLLVEAGRDAGLPDLESDRFAEEIGRMYRAWGDKRHMRVEVLHEQRGSEREPFRLLLAVGGFGSHTILATEDGLHVLETPAERGRGFDRARAHVAVVPQLGDPGDGSAAALRRGADEALARRDRAEPRIVRRYRTEPSPLVRDGVRGWRTGRIERVLGGEFDVMGTDL